MVLAIPYVDGWMLDRVVDWDPGPRLNPLVATILLFGVPSVVLGTVSPVAVRLKAQLARAPRPDRRPAVRDLDGGLDRRDVPHRVLADP